MVESGTRRLLEKRKGQIGLERGEVVLGFSPFSKYRDQETSC